MFPPIYTVNCYVEPRVPTMARPPTRVLKSGKIMLTDLRPCTNSDDFLGHSVVMLSHIDFVSFILSHDNKVLGGGGTDPGGVA